MKRAMLMTTLFVGFIIIGGWLFFTHGGTKREPLSESEQAVLDVQDKRLTKGDKNAPVKIVEYADILCPYCAKANEDTIPQIEADYIDSGKVHYEVRLVAMISPDSQRAAEGAYCAAEQGKFWSYIDTAYSETWDNYYSQNKKPADVPLFTQANISSFASTVGVAKLPWQDCMETSKYKETISQNQETMREMKAYGTPHFIINGKNYNGSPPYAAFKAVIDGELNKSKAGS